MKNIYFIEDEITYTGKELRSGWIEETTGLGGDAMAAFLGPADVPIENMVDMDDVARNAPIFSPLMLHFLVEHRGISLADAVLRQRLLVAIIADELRRYSKASNIKRHGDDLYDGNRKLSVSIAAPSPSSCCIHVALNVETEGTPLPTVGLVEYGIAPAEFAKNAMRLYVQELDGIMHACSKVRTVP